VGNGAAEIVEERRALGLGDRRLRVSWQPPPFDQRIRLERGDITRLAVDAIVNAANSSLLGGGGVDGAIHRAAGPALQTECRTLGGCPPGEARLTAGYRLPARHVIHTVGPIWRGGVHGERDILARCYNSCLAIARDRGFCDIAFPAIATGVYGFPHDAAAEIAVAAVRSHLAVHDAPRQVIFVCFDDAALAAYRRALGMMAG
jgi:O-acetyl-ADP-ribose deacetylase